MGAEGAKPQINLPPGFRFYPTDEELVVHYLCKKAASQPFPVPVIAEVDLYKFNPWDLPEKALFGEREWYFFSPRERKYPNGSRPNRAAASGYWKATGTDKSITTVGGGKVGVKKTLVFYQGRPAKGVKTNWIMQEYCLADSASRAVKRAGSLRLDGWVLCRVYKKLYGAQKGAVARKLNAEPTWQEGELASSSPEIDGTQAPINLSRISKLNRISSFKSAMRYDHKPCQNGAADKSSGALRVVNIDQPAWTKFVGRGPNLAENVATDANPAIVAEAGSAGMRPKEEPLEMDCSLWEKPRISTETTAEEIRQISDAPLQRLPSLQMLFGLDLIDGLFPPLEPIPPLGDEDAFFATF